MYTTAYKMFLSCTWNMFTSRVRNNKSHTYSAKSLETDDFRIGGGITRVIIIIIRVDVERHSNGLSMNNTPFCFCI